MDNLQIVLFAVIAVFFVKWFLSYKKKRDLGNKIQGPYSLPIIGNLELAFLGPTKILGWLYGNSKKFPRFYKMWMGLDFWIINYDPELSEKILTNPKLVKSSDYHFLMPWLGRGLLLKEGQQWFGRRKAITPAFHFNILEEFLEIFARHADVLTTKFDIGKAVDVTPLSLNCAFDIICGKIVFDQDKISFLITSRIPESSMGLEMNSQNESNVPYVKAVDQ